MRILVMGGTRFNGLHLVYELLKHGHEVTILNRGITEAPVPKIVKRLYADRKDPQQLGNALQNLEFDVVFDISAYVVEDVKYLTDIMVGRTGHYIFASSTVVYAENNILLCGFLFRDLTKYRISIAKDKFFIYCQFLNRWHLWYFIH